MVGRDSGDDIRKVFVISDDVDIRESVRETDLSTVHSAFETVWRATAHFRCVVFMCRCVHLVVNVFMYRCVHLVVNVFMCRCVHLVVNVFMYRCVHLAVSMVIC